MVVGVTMAVAVDNSFTIDVNFAFDFVVMVAEWLAVVAPGVGRIEIGFLIAIFGVDKRSVTSLTRPLRRTGDVRLKDAYAVDFVAIVVVTELLAGAAVVQVVVVPMDATVFNLIDFLLVFEMDVTDCDAFAL